MDEPTNPDRYISTQSTMLQDGKKGWGEVKVWYDADGKRHERVLSFEVRAQDYE